MAPFSFRLHFPFITSIIFLIITPANGENAKYAACSTLYTCGKIQKVGYPFWGESRPKYCGISDFKLSCDDKNTSFNVFDNLDFELRVQGINTSSHTMNFSLEKISKYCYLQNITIMKIIRSTLILNAAYNETVSLFYGCDNHRVSNHHSKKSFTCSTYGDGTKGTGYYFGQSSKGRRIGKDCSCKNNITVPVDEKVLDELRSTNASVVDILTRRPIETKYKVNFIDHCVKCEHSGGRCGSSDNPSSDRFVCYCEDGPSSLVCHTTEEKKVKLILGLGIGGAIAVVVAITAIWHCKKLFVTQSASLDISASELEKGSIYFSVPLFSYSELVEATANFNQSNELGDGGFGIVFYGKLNDGREVAVKRLYEKSYKRVEQFMNEVRILTLLRHQNLVSLYGCTSHHCKDLLLVYEYVKNGTVSDHLYSLNCKSVSLPWPVRLRIAIETATALSYLHASDIIHRDVKTNNILLDSNFGVKVADFGLSRLFPTDATHVSTAPQGTPGYLDPQYHQCYQLTNKSDVYSFGVVLIELISSLPAIDMNRDNHEINLSTFAMSRIQRCAFDELVDPQLGFVFDFKVRRMITSVAELAFQCLQHDKELRPSMDEALEVLKRIESTDYEALSQAEETANIDEEEMLNMHTSNPPPTPAEDDHAELLSNHKLFSSSPISVMGKWVSGSTTYSSSK